MSAGERLPELVGDSGRQATVRETLLAVGTQRHLGRGAVGCRRQRQVDDDVLQSHAADGEVDAPAPALLAQGGRVRKARREPPPELRGISRPHADPLLNGRSQQPRAPRSSSRTTPAAAAPTAHAATDRTPDLAPELPGGGEDPDEVLLDLGRNPRILGAHERGRYRTARGLSLSDERVSETGAERGARGSQDEA